MSSALATGIGTPLSRNTHLLSWIEECVRLTKPDRVVWCDGSAAEKDALTQEAVRLGILIPLNQKKLPGCYLHRSNPNDVARTEQLTFICTRTKEEAGPTNNWMAPEDAYGSSVGSFDGSMTGRTLYVVPYVMGPIGSPLAKVGVELTDSLYVVLNMGIMTRMGRRALDALGSSNDFNRGLHSMLDLNPERRFICHFPEDNTVWSVGSGYGGNALLGKKCLALRIGSFLGRREGWMAEHMLIVGAEDPNGETTYVAAAFPSACGKTNFAMLIPPKRFRRLEGQDGGRRHLLDASRTGRPALGHQPRGGLLRRGARHEPRHESERDAHDQQGHDLHERGADPGRRRVVGRQGPASRPKSCIDWQGRPGGTARRRRRRIRTAASPRR